MPATMLTPDLTCRQRITHRLLVEVVLAGYGVAAKLDHMNEALARWCEGKGFI